MHQYKKLYILLDTLNIIQLLHLMNERKKGLANYCRITAKIGGQLRPYMLVQIRVAYTHTLTIRTQTNGQGVENAK